MQEGEEFNQQGTLEIAYKALAEFVVNALIHRSLNWNAPIRVFIFDNRVERALELVIVMLVHA